jgi:hypothetical protein
MFRRPLAQRLPGQQPAVWRSGVAAFRTQAPLVAREVVAIRTSPIIVMSSAARVQRSQRLDELGARASAFFACVPQGKHIHHLQVESIPPPSLAAAYASETAKRPHSGPALGQMVRHVLILSLEAILRGLI